MLASMIGIILTLIGILGTVSLLTQGKAPGVAVGIAIVGVVLYVASIVMLSRQNTGASSGPSH